MDKGLLEVRWATCEVGGDEEDIRGADAAAREAWSGLVVWIVRLAVR